MSKLIVYMNLLHFYIKIEVIDFLNLLDEFIKRLILKKKIDENTIKHKIHDLKISNFTNNKLNMIIEHIFSN